VVVVVVVILLSDQLQITSNGNKTANIYVKNCSVYIQCKGDIVVLDIKQHKSQFKNSNITITQCQKNFVFLHKFVYNNRPITYSKYLLWMLVHRLCVLQTQYHRSY